MAKRAYAVEGKTASQLMDMDLAEFQSLDARQLRAVVTRLASAANRRVRTLEKLGVGSPALALVKRQGGTFTTKGKSDLTDLRKEFVRVRNFMSLPSSTKKGAMESIKKMQEDLATNAGISLTAEQTGEMWETYDKLKKRKPKLEEIKYEVVIPNIAKRIESGQAGRQLLRNMREMLHRREVAEQKELKKRDSVSGFFRKT